MTDETKIMTFAHVLAHDKDWPKLAVNSVIEYDQATTQQS